MYAPISAPAASSTTGTTGTTGTTDTWDLEVQSLANAVTIRAAKAMTTAELRSEIAQKLGIAAQNQLWHVQGERLNMQDPHNIWWQPMTSHNRQIMTHYDHNDTWCTVGNFHNFHNFLLQHDVVPRCTTCNPMMTYHFRISHNQSNSISNSCSSHLIAFACLS